MESPTFQRLAPPGVSLLIVFLGATSQWLFYQIEPGPLQKEDVYLINTLMTCILLCYWRTCLLKPGEIPKNWQDKVKPSLVPLPQTLSREAVTLSNLWCRKCEAFKPPRAHHCKVCKRCVMKMDHHCVWTANCVSHTTIPHFIRFLFYAVVGMSYLEYLLFLRASCLWDKRHLPSYLGPSNLLLAHFFILGLVNSFVLFALSLLLSKTLWSLAMNTWTIESWEIERHHALLRRARAHGGYLNGPDGTRVYIKHQEFPWDVGILTNICQGMGTSNPLAWFWPFSFSPSVQSGLTFPHNRIDDPKKPWPPPDPDRLYRARAPRPAPAAVPFGEPWDVEQFRQRQTADLTRVSNLDDKYLVRRKPYHENPENPNTQAQQDITYFDDQAYQGNGSASDSELDYTQVSEDEGKRGRSRRSRTVQSAPQSSEDQSASVWRNQEGERLADFGVDEDADFVNDDDIPLAQLIARRQL